MNYANILEDSNALLSSNLTISPTTSTVALSAVAVYQQRWAWDSLSDPDWDNAMAIVDLALKELQIAHIPQVPHTDSLFYYYLPGDADYQDQARSTPASAGDPVGSMGDASGNARYFYQTVGSRKAVLASNYLDFDGVDDRYDSALYDIGTKWTLTFCIEPTASGSIDFDWVRRSDSGTDYVLVVVTGALFCRPGGTSSRNVSYTGWLSGTKTVIQVHRVDTSVSFFADNSQIGTTQTFPSNPVNNYNQLADTSSADIGNLYELSIHQNLDSGQRQEVSDYFCGKYL